MHEIQETIEIRASTEQVFTLLKNIYTYVKLNPFLEVLWVEKLNNEATSIGSRYRIIAKRGKKRLDFVTEWIEYEENKKIISLESTGKTKLTLTLQETPSGTLLIHKEEFEIPFEIVFRDDFDEGEIPLWRKILFFTMPDPNIEYTSKAEKIKERLRLNLKQFLEIIKERVEKDNPFNT